MITRYRAEINDDYNCPEMRPDKRGDWVEWSECEAFLEKCAALAECYDLGTPDGHAIAAAIRKLKEQS